MNNAFTSSSTPSIRRDKSPSEADHLFKELLEGFTRSWLLTQGSRARESADRKPSKSLAQRIQQCRNPTPQDGVGEDGTTESKPSKSSGKEGSISVQGRSCFSKYEYSCSVTRTQRTKLRQLRIHLHKSGARVTAKASGHTPSKMFQKTVTITTQFTGRRRSQASWGRFLKRPSKPFRASGPGRTPEHRQLA